MANPDAVEELKMQLEDHDDVVFLLEHSDGVVLDITDVRFEDNQIVVTMKAVHT